MSTVASRRPGRPPLPLSPRQPSSGTARWLAVGLLAIVIAAVAYGIVSSGGPTTYHLLFTDAGQLVKGDEVQVGGVSVGSVKSIALNSNNLADVTIAVSSPIAPLHAGTTAQIRQASLSGVANRYISLTPGPNSSPRLPDGATLPVRDTHGIVDLDQVLNSLDAPTRRALQEVIQGSAAQYAGASSAIHAAIPYFPPALQSLDHVLAELDRDQAAFTNFILATARTAGALSARAPQISALVANGNQAMGAIGHQSASLQAGLHELPATLQAGNRAFADLNPTLDALTRLVDVSKPNTKTLAPFLRDLAPLLRASIQPVSDVGYAISRPGPHNDLTDAARDLPALGAAFGKTSPDTVASLQQAVPITSFLRPYAPDLVGWLRSFGQNTAYYDANGHYARISFNFADFGLNGNVLSPINPAQGLAGLRTGQTHRCPGAATQPPADGSAPFTDGGALDCNPTQVPAG